MSAYVDCLACACLIRAREPSCPFCGTSQHHAPAPSRIALGFTLGLGLALFGCGDKEGGDSDTETANSDTVNNSDTVDPSDPTYEADAVTYAGPDETETIGDGTTFFDTDSSGTTTDTQATSGSTGTGGSTSG